jgi:hypothetical protein
MPSDFKLSLPVKGKGKALPRTGDEGPEWEWRHGSTFSFTSALDGVCGQSHTIQCLLYNGYLVFIIIVIIIIIIVIDSGSAGSQ